MMEMPRTKRRVRPCNNSNDISNLMELPMELLVEILKRVPAKWVCHIRCVSKMLLTIVDKPSFVVMHSNFLLDPDSHVPAAPPQLILRHVHSHLWPNKLSTLYTLDYHHSNAQGAQLNVRDILQSSSHRAPYNKFFAFCNLLCLKHGGDHALSFLINPFRGEVLRLPPSHSIAQQVYGPDSRTEFVWAGMGFDSITNTYKILRVTEIRVQYSLVEKRVLQVLELGTSVWRQVHSVPPFNCLSCFKNVCAYGNMHWLCNATRQGIQDETHILSFDFKKEDFFWFPTPYILPDIIWKLHLIAFRGSMAIVDTTSGVNIEIWVMKDYNKKQWVLDYSVNIDMLELDPEFEFNRALCSEWEHGILFIDKEGTITVFLDLRGPVVTKNIFKCPIEGRGVECNSITSLKGGLISLRSFANLAEAEEPASYTNWTQGEASGKHFFYLKRP